MVRTTVWLLLLTAILPHTLQGLLVTHARKDQYVCTSNVQGGFFTWPPSKLRIATVPEDRTWPRLLLAQRMKPQRDRAVVRALLRVLGVAFAEAEIIAPVEAPIDVRFRRVQFHLRELGDHPRGVHGKSMTRGCIRRVRL